MTDPRPVGRPSLYSDQLADTICEKLIAGESLRAICRLPSMPDASTIFNWLTQHEYFSSKYARARDIQAELGFDYLQEIGDDGTNDWMTANDPDNPGYKANGENIQRSKLRAETLRWRLEKLKPKKYGPKVETTLRTEPGAPLEISASLDPIEAAKLYHKIMGT